MAFKNKIILNPKTRNEIKFLQTSKDSDGKILEMESTYFANSKEPPPHYHPYQEEDFTILSGGISMRINGRINILKQGESIHIPANTVHSMWNNSDNKTIVNWKVRPAMETEFMLETLIGLAKDGKTNEEGVPELLQISLTANKFSNVLRLDNPPFILQKIIFTLLSPLSIALGYRATYSKYIDR
jgi:quercetin dioxygenase-like cupin family protein